MRQVLLESRPEAKFRLAGPTCTRPSTGGTLGEMPAARAPNRSRLLVLVFLHALSIAAWSDNLWLESSSSAPFPELELTAVPLSRTAWRMLSERRIQVRLDGRSALLLSVKPVPEPPRILLLLDHSDAALAEAAVLGPLFQDFLEALPAGTQVDPFVLGRQVVRATGGPRPAGEIMAALRRIPHDGAAAALGRGLLDALGSLPEVAGPPPLLVVFSMTRDPDLGEGSPTRSTILRRLEAHALPVVALSMGSSADRTWMRQLGEERGGMSVHSWSSRNLQSALARLASGLRLAHHIRVQSPLHDQDGSLRNLEVRVAGGDQVLAEGRIRLPGIPPPLPPPTPSPGPPPPPPVPPPWIPPAPPPTPRRPVPPLPSLRLGSWPIPAGRPGEEELASLASAQLHLLEAHAEAVLSPALAGVRLAVDNRDRPLAERLYRRARVGLAFLGNTYGRVATSIEQALELHAQGKDADPAFLASQRARLDRLREDWNHFKQALKDWEFELDAMPAR